MPCTAQFAEACKDQAYDFLQSQIRIKTQSNFPMPDVAERHADTQIAAVSLRAFGIEHARTKHVELEFTDAAFHSEQQPVVCPTRIVHTVQVDYPGLDKPAEFKQMMPVAPVTCKT